MNDKYLVKAKRKNWQELPKEEQWVYGYYARGFNVHEEPIFIIFDPTTVFDKNKTDGWDEIEPYTLCRCTDLTDKNKNPIWENDVIKHYNYQDKPEQYDIGVILWNKQYARYERSSIHDNKNYIVDRECKYEVIGNTFDVPELLDIAEKTVTAFRKLIEMVADAYKN